jgi:ribA/ribD-fused uncharacterized protein
MKTIDRFDGPYRWLSNFHPARITVRGVDYRSVEHAFQACKTLDLPARERIRQASSPAIAKKLGRYVDLRPDWLDIRRDVMYACVRMKFTRHQHLGVWLRDTGDALLVEGNTWGDTYWGVCNGKGENHLGLILMRVREMMG